MIVSQVALLPSQLPLPSLNKAAPGMRPVYIVEGPPAIIDTLSRYACLICSYCPHFYYPSHLCFTIHIDTNHHRNENIRLVSIWISLQTKEQFVAGATALLQTQVICMYIYMILPLLYYTYTIIL